MAPVLEGIPIIDTHVHLWDVQRLDYPWLNDVPAIRKTFLIEDFQNASENFAINKMVFVQCECLPEQCLLELEFVMEQARKDERIQGIVAYAPMEQGSNVTNLLDTYKQNPMIKGVRRMYDDNPKLCTSDSFLEAVHLLPKYNLSFDISILPSSAPTTISMVKSCPGTLFVLDHLGKPGIRNKAFDEFCHNIDQLASCPNVVAKLSGLITEANWNQWSVDVIRPYVEYTVHAFGYQRLMFGGDWPVVLLAGNYVQWLTSLVETLSFANKHELMQVFYENAQQFYKLK